MAGELLLINPRRRKRRGGMPAGLKRYWAAKRNPRGVPRSGVRKPRRRNRARAGQRGYKARATRVGRYMRARAKRSYANPRRRRARRNPLPTLRGLQGMLTPALIGGAGAVALDVLYAQLPIPAAYKAGAFAPVVKAAAVIAVGEIARKLRVGGRMVDIAVGTSLAIIAANFIRAQVATTFPSVAMGAYLDYGYDNPQLSYASAAPFLPAPSNMSAYVGMDMAGLSPLSNTWNNDATGDEIS